MIELVVGAVVGYALAVHWQIPWQALAPVGAFVAYTVSCWFRPNAVCPSPFCRKSDQIVGKTSAKYRRRRPCQVCGNGDYVRLGARWMGRG